MATGGYKSQKRLCLQECEAQQKIQAGCDVIVVHEVRGLEFVVEEGAGLYKGAGLVPFGASRTPIQRSLRTCTKQRVGTWTCGYFNRCDREVPISNLFGGICHFLL